MPGGKGKEERCGGGKGRVKLGPSRAPTSRGAGREYKKKIVGHVKHYTASAQMPRDKIGKSDDEIREEYSGECKGIHRVVSKKHRSRLVKNESPRSRERRGESVGQVAVTPWGGLLRKPWSREA